MISRDAFAGLVDIYVRHNCLQASTVVEEATPEDSVLHPLFEWNDSKAAHQHRLSQARKLIKKANEHMETRQDRFIHVPFDLVEDARGTQAEGQFHPVKVVKGNPQAFERALRAALMRVEAAYRDVENLRDIANENEEENLTIIMLAIRSAFKQLGQYRQ